MKHNTKWREVAEVMRQNLLDERGHKVDPDFLACVWSGSAHAPRASPTLLNPNN
jgi:hypothetical protein